MDAAPIIFARLNGATSAGNRVHPMYLPQSPVYPAVSYFQVSATPVHAMGNDVDLWRVRMQVDVWGETYASARTLADEVRGRLSRWKGIQDDVRVIDTLFDDEDTPLDPDMQLYRVSTDWTLLLTTV
jgi:hypothetical protein